MHYYLAFVVSVGAHGLKSKPHPYTVRAKTAYDAEDKLREWLGEGKYEIDVAEPIGCDDDE